MKMPEQIDPIWLAPCGVNCLACTGHLRKKPCGGCRGPQELIRQSCRSCARRNCAEQRGLTWCHECGDFPCKYIKTLDKTYRTRYKVSLIGNLERAREAGVETMLAGERERWLCECGGIICQHDGSCSECEAVPRGDRP